MIYFDLDNTLIDYNSSERKAIEFIFKEKYGLVLNNNQTDYWSKISRKYFDYYLSKQITFEEQGKNRFIKMLSYCGYVENEKIGMKCVLVDRNSICEKNICKIKNLYEIHNVLLNDIGQYNTELSIRSSAQ